MPRNRRGWAFRENEISGVITHTPLTVALLEPALLILINEQARHGYFLMSELEMLGMGTINPSVIYRTLRELEVLGWILSDWQTEQTQGPPRRVYYLTDRGKNILNAWKNELEKARISIDQLIGRIDVERSQ